VSSNSHRLSRSIPTEQFRSVQPSLLSGDLVILVCKSLDERNEQRFSAVLPLS
jgi:hypothetical protein